MRFILMAGAVACFLVATGCTGPSETGSTAAQVNLSALSEDGQYGVIKEEEEDRSGSIWTVVRILSLQSLEYEILDTLRGDLRFADFCGSNGLLYGRTDSICTSILYMDLDSLCQVDTVIACAADSCPPPDLNDISWATYAPSRRILALRCGAKDELLRIRPDGAFYRFFAYEMDVRAQSFDTDGSELILFYSSGISDTNTTVMHHVMRVYDMDGDTFSGAGMYFGNVERVVRCRGRGEPIYYLRRESDLSTANVWKYDRVVRNRFRITDFSNDMEVLNFWLIGDSVVSYVLDRNLQPPDNRRLIIGPG